jgi:pimeloyl-ACP methyl ester carboxylesterase
MEEIGLDSVHLVGHSMGGYVGLAFAERYAQRLGSLCLFHSHCYADSQEVVEKRLREVGIVEAGRKEVLIRQSIPQGFAATYRHRHTNYVERAIEIAQRQDDKGIVACLHAMRRRPNRCPIWEGLTTKSLLIAGAEDAYIAPRRNVEMASKLGSEVVWLPESGHMGFFEQPDKSREALQKFWIG